MSLCRLVRIFGFYICCDLSSIDVYFSLLLVFVVTRWVFYCRLTIFVVFVMLFVFDFVLFGLVNVLRRGVRNCLLDMLMCLSFKYFLVVF